MSNGFFYSCLDQFKIKSAQQIVLTKATTSPDWNIDNNPFFSVITQKYHFSCCKKLDNRQQM